ncbi:hypothetical protein B0H66DRAFT_344975 [Apodospora peruviana]|uniref:Transmembrane protein n=1 Tax=Apodospora peruviana TaxID=516989 RepID=A0AAE0HZ30_9PEZI|nr:hypothetical protein B0H66DRAFT_344975 [Apodospora peruviana]
MVKQKGLINTQERKEKLLHSRGPRPSLYTVVFVRNTYTLLRFTWLHSRCRFLDPTLRYPNTGGCCSPCFWIIPCGCFLMDTVALFFFCLDGTTLAVLSILDTSLHFGCISFLLG